MIYGELRKSPMSKFYWDSFFIITFLLTVQNTFTDKRILQEERCPTASYSYLIYYLYTIHLLDISVNH